MNAKHHLIVLIVFSLSCMGASCRGSNTSDSFTGSSGGLSATSNAYSGPGSAWSITLHDNGEFYITESDEVGEPLTMTVTGTYLRYDGGFIEFTVDEAQGDDAPEVDDTTVALEIPGYAFLFQPFGADEELIPLLTSGICPTEDVTSNWIAMTCNSGGAACDAESDSEPFFGVFDYTYASGQSSLSSRFVLDDGSDLGASVIGTEACDEGVSQPTGAVVYLSELPGAVVHLNPDDHDEARHLMGLPQQTLSSGDLAGDYLGFVFDQNTDASQPAQIAVASGGGSAVLTEVDPELLVDLYSGDEIATMTFDTVNTVEATSADGWMTATYSAVGEADTVMYCTAAVDVGDDNHSVILCVGQSPSDTEEFYNVVMVSESY